MIVTRQRPKKRNTLPIILPIAALAMLAIALSWPPSRKVITSGPFQPITRVVEAVWGQVSRPLTFAWQQQQITDRNIEIKKLSDQLESDRRAQAAKDGQVQSLQKQVAALNEQPPPVTPSPPPIVRRALTPGGPPELAQPATPPDVAQVKQTALQWSAMDPQKAAQLVTALPDDYVAKVFAQMAPDDVGAVLDNLPAKVAARLVKASAQLSASVGR